jgi:VWFA-related protein
LRATRVLLGVILVTAAGLGPAWNLAAGQSPPANGTATSASSTGGSAAAPGQEISSHDEVTTFKVKVNLVLVRVVVRDSKGHAIGNLRQEDFELSDNRKPQVIRQFSMERPGERAAAQQAAQKAQEGSGSELPPPIAPTHYVAYVFDDVHIEFGDLARLRDAAERHIAALAPTDRAAIFTTSGLGSIDFTDDRDKLHQALLHLQPRPLSRSPMPECPDVTHYMADLIENQNDNTALGVATTDALNCAFDNDPRMVESARGMARSSAARALATGDHESQVSLTVLKDVIRRVSAAPGQRTMLLLSPGFLTPRMEFQYSELIDIALRAQVVISSLDVRGLYVVDPAGDIRNFHALPADAMTWRNRYFIDSALANEDILAVLADSTGGNYFHNSNDFDEGLRRIAAEPEYWYVLGFSPQNLKFDGKFHSLKVSVRNPAKVAIQARKGYYAPKHKDDPAEEAKQEIEDALFSQEEMHDLPIDLHTQFFKSTDFEAKLAVLCHVDLKKLHFHKADGRNASDLTIVSGLFDRNGKYITGSEKILEMHLKDDTLAYKLGSGITVKSSFDVKPGGYLVRLVVRDGEGSLSAANGTIEIP